MLIPFNGLDLACCSCCQSLDPIQEPKITNSPLLRCLAATTVAALCAASNASPVVNPGSTYAAVVLGSSTTGPSSGLSIFNPVTFDGVAQTFTRTKTDGSTEQVTINESQSDLGGGVHSIHFSFNSDQDMFPVSGENGFINIGFPNNALDLLEAVTVTSWNLSFLNSAGASIASGPFGLPTTTVWDGTFLAPAIAGGFKNLGGLGVTGITLDIVVADIPEPATLALMGIALASLAATRRRKQ